MVERYEDLRRSGHLDGGGLGRALLISRGMTAWIAAWGSCVPPADRERPGMSGRDLRCRGGSSRGAILPEGIQGEAVRVLAGMAVVVINGR